MNNEFVIIVLLCCVAFSHAHITNKTVNIKQNVVIYRPTNLVNGQYVPLTEILFTTSDILVDNYYNNSIEYKEGYVNCTLIHDYGTARQSWHCQGWVLINYETKTYYDRDFEVYKVETEDTGMKIIVGETETFGDSMINALKIFGFFCLICFALAGA